MMNDLCPLILRSDSDFLRTIKNQNSIIRGFHLTPEPTELSHQIDLSNGKLKIPESVIRRSKDNYCYIVRHFVDPTMGD